MEVTTEDVPFTVFLAGFYRGLLSPDFVAKLIKGNKLGVMFFKRSKDVLFSFEGVIDAAKDKQLQDPAVKKWLNLIKDAFYVADDLLNQIATKSEPAEEVSNFENIIHRLESIFEHTDFLGLKQISSVDLSNGRGSDKEFIMKLLLRDNIYASMYVTPIFIGMDEVGKTTSAQLMYNDDNLKQNFDLKAWVCVTQDFDERIIEAAALSDCKIDASLDSLQSIVEAADLSGCKMDVGLVPLQLQSKKQLSATVLEDIWNDDWNHASPFQYESKRKYLVITRSKKVASAASALLQTSRGRGRKVYELKQLFYEDIYLVLAEYLNLRARFNMTNSSLEEISREIVNKCKGSPLAMQIIGGLLQAKHNIKDWKNILKSDIWKFYDTKSAITPAMEICYDYLPAHLKRCFAFCSLLPKHYKFTKDELISLWMAQGLLQSSNSEKTLEEIGNDYFHYLVSRSFLQYASQDGIYRSYVMHYLIHDFATSKANELRTFLPLNQKEDLSSSIKKEDLSTRTLPTSQGQGWIQIRPFLSLTLPTSSSNSILQHQWMILIRVRNLKLQIELWRLVGFVSGEIGMLCLALSPSFSHLIGGWNSFKFVLYGLAIFILCITTLLAKKCTLSRRGKLKAHVGFAVLILTSLYSFRHDKAMNGKPDLWSMISNGAFALMSLSLSRVLKLGFEVGMFAFFQSSLVIQLATIKLVLIPVAIVYGLPLYLIHSHSNADSDYPINFAFDECDKVQLIANSFLTSHCLLFVGVPLPLHRIRPICHRYELGPLPSLRPFAIVSH